MKTKTLLIAAAALAAGVMSSQAQVYSQNIVGYVNVVLPGNGQYSLVANPFDDGNGNYATNVLSSALPRQSQVLTWDSVLGYTTVQKVGSPVANWPAGTSVQVPPGVGFFVRNGGVGSGAPTITNTFVGSIVVPPGGSVTNQMPVGYTLQGSVIPYAGNLAVSGQGGGDTNIDYGSPLTRQSQILTWDPVVGFTTVQKVGSPVSTWNGTATVGVGQGFFIYNKNGPATNMIQSASY
jgi:hypothetical protein